MLHKPSSQTICFSLKIIKKFSKTAINYDNTCLSLNYFASKLKSVDWSIPTTIYSNIHFGLELTRQIVVGIDESTDLSFKANIQMGC